MALLQPPREGLPHHAHQPVLANRSLVARRKTTGEHVFGLTGVRHRDCDQLMIFVVGDFTESNRVGLPRYAKEIAARFLDDTPNSTGVLIGDGMDL